MDQKSFPTPLEYRSLSFLHFFTIKLFFHRTINYSVYRFNTFNMDAILIDKDEVALFIFFLFIFCSSTNNQVLHVLNFFIFIYSHPQAKKKVRPPQIVHPLFTQWKEVRTTNKVSFLNGFAGCLLLKRKAPLESTSSEDCDKRKLIPVTKILNLGKQALSLLSSE